MMKFNNILIFISLMAVLLSGCANNREMYYWGEYETLIRESYVNPGSADPLTQIEKITTDIQKTEAFGRKTPPGIYAHLGYLYAVQGEVEKSKEAFMEEKSLYPESATFIDGMLARAMKSEEMR